MWILECDGDVLKHKRVWLRPGKTYLFGRTKPEIGRYQTGFQINHKTVSRKHLILKVATVQPDDVGILAKRTEITFEDAGTKLGTKIDETKISAEGNFASVYDVHVFKLGGYEHAFKVTWKPVVFSYTLSSKELKSGKDPLAPVRARLADLDVKALPTYASTKTTHVITTKRNTARGLQALVQGARIVTDEFVGALEVAATTTDLAEAESFAPLETDFDAGWPNETQFLPAPGKEPGPKDADIYDPASERREIFSGMTFIFFDSRQYDSLQAPITDGGGKAVLANFDAGVTTVQEAHRLVKEAAGEHDDGELSGDNKVVCVKFGSFKGFEDWSVAFVNNLCLANGFRMIEQNEFLEAILTKSTAKLFKRLEYVDDHGTTSSHSSNVAQQAAEPPAPARPPRRALRGPIKSVFKGFDTGSDDDDYKPAPAPMHAPTPSTHQNGTHTNGTHTNGILNNEMEVNETTDTREAKQTNGCKRRLPDSEDEDEQALRKHNEDFFRGTDMIKRRRLESARLGNDNASSGQTTRETSELIAADETTQKKKKETKKELDIKAALRAQREAEDEKQDHSAEDDDEDNLTAEQMRNLAVVEECNVRTTPRPRLDRNGVAHGDNWNPDWNGRKNFKKFRKQGSAETRRGQRVIVPLEEAKDPIVTSVNFSHTASTSNSRTGQARHRVESSDEEEGASELRGSAGTRTPRSRPSQAEVSLGKGGDPQAVESIPSDEEGVPETVPSNLQTGPDANTIDVDKPRATRAHGSATQLQVAATQQSSTLRGAKRKQAATQSSVGTAAGPKRQRTVDEGSARMPRAAVSDSESGDDLKFKFRRKAKAKT